MLGCIQQVLLFKRGDIFVMSSSFAQCELYLPLVLPNAIYYPSSSYLHRQQQPVWWCIVIILVHLWLFVKMPPNTKKVNLYERAWLALFSYLMLLNVRYLRCLHGQLEVSWNLKYVKMFVRPQIIIFIISDVFVKRYTSFYTKYHNFNI